ncbi:MAG: CHAT domain-containing tetratricopeptide repeat protein [Coleofasciculus sp. B1-GNL1-01]|uniref:CHAT domain-containing protein n=1 Tax=Coleofasciculus sp. B1-GNL1-01 TaxID=3068484 RepID=UPI0032F12449
MAKGFGQSTSKGKTGRQFFERLWDASEAGNQDQVYRLLEENADTLTDNFAQLVREDAELKLRRANKRQRGKLAGKLWKFSGFINEFPRGNRASHIEIAIACCQVLTKFSPRRAFPVQWATLQNDLGACYSDRIRGDRAENLKVAISYYEAALPVRTREAFPQDWAMTQINLGVAYDETKQFTEAIATYQNALEICTRKEFPQYWAMTQMNLGVAYKETKQFAEAIAAYQNALEVYTREAFPESWAMMQNNLGNAYRDAGQSKLAIPCLQAALEVLTREAFPEKWAVNQYNLATAYSDLGQIDAAITYFRSSLEILQPAAFPVRCLKAGRDFGNTAFNAEKWQTAIEGYAAAIEAVEISCSWASTNQRRQEILAEAMDVYTQIVQACLNNHQPKLALEYVERSKARNLVQLFADAESTLHPKGDQVDRKIRQQIERLKAQITDKHKQLDNLGEEAGLKGNPIQFRFSDELWEEDAIDETANPTPQAALDSPPASLIDPPPVPLQKGEAKGCFAFGSMGEAFSSQENSKPLSSLVFVLLSVLKTSATEGSENSNPNQLYTQRLRQELEELQAKFDQILDQILEADPAYALTQAVQPIRFAEIMHLLDEKTTIIEWYITEKRFFAFVITHNQEPYVWQSQPDDLTQLNQWQQDYLNDYQHDNRQWCNDLSSRLETLAQILHLDHILTQSPLPKDCQQLILIPHRYLHLFPLHALPVLSSSVDNPQDTGNTTAVLLDQFPDGVRYAPSCQLLQLSQKRCHEPQFSQTTASKHLFAMQNPTEDLNFADVEVEAISRYFHPADILPSQRATKEIWTQATTQNQLRLANFIHFSGHGYFNFESPLRSALVLSGATLSEIPETDESRYIQSPDKHQIDLEKCLLLEEIFALDLRPCRLVTLSACETSLTDPKSLSDDYISLPSGFLVAGSPSIVGSQWTVCDIATAFLMIEFYRNLVGQSQNPSELSPTPISVAKALKTAQCWLRDVTKDELRDWLKPLNLSPERQQEVERELKLSLNERPFSQPAYWAAFCAIGQ